MLDFYQVITYNSFKGKMIILASPGNGLREIDDTFCVYGRKRSYIIVIY